MNTWSAARTAIVAAAAVVVIVGLRLASPVLTPILLALMMAIIWSGFPAWLRSKGIEGYWTTVVAIVAVLAVFVLLGAITTYYALRLEERWPTYEEKVIQLREDVEGLVNDTGITDEPVDLERVFSEDVFNGRRLASLGRTAATQAFGVLGLVFLVTVFSLFMLAESRDWGAKLNLYSSERQDPVAKMTEYIEDVRRWVWITLVGGAMVAVPSAILFMIFQVDFAIFWGILILIGSYVPNVGFIVSVGPPVVLALLLRGPIIAGIILGLILVINTIVDNFIKPRIIGRSLRLSPLVTLVGLVFWAWMLGPLGAFLASPLTLAVRYLFELHPDTEWLAKMMGPAPDDDTPVPEQAASTE